MELQYPPFLSSPISLFHLDTVPPHDPFTLLPVRSSFELPDVVLASEGGSGKGLESFDAVELDFVLAEFCEGEKREISVIERGKKEGRR